jgi:predicted permease
MMGTLWQDIKYGARMLAKSPGFTAVAVISLAIGIGANTAIFSLFNGVLLKSLPVRDPHELRVVNWVGHNPVVSNYTGGGIRSVSDSGQVASSFPYATYRDLRDGGTGFAEMFAFSQLFGCTALTPAGATTSDGLMVSGNFFRGYGAQTLMGRPLAPEDDRPDAAPVAVISYRWWERQFGLDPNTLGQTVFLNKLAFTIVGVLPQRYVGPTAGDSTDFYVPMSAQPQLLPNYPLESYDHWWVEIMARLAPGADPRRMQASLEGTFKQTLSAPGVTTKMDQPGIVLEDGSRGPLMARQRMAEPVYVLMAAVGLVLLVTCANLAGLLLARGAVRQHEYAVRGAIGGGRWRLVRQSLTESLLLALAGGAFGLLLAWWGKAVILGIVSSHVGHFHVDTSTDARVLAFTFGVSLATALLFGLLPALRSAWVAPAAAIKDHAALGTPRLRLGRVLVTIQVGLSLLLVVSAGLFVRTFANLSRVDPGFDTENLLLFQLNADQAGYKDNQLTNFYDGLSRSLAAIPGVRAVSFSSMVPLGGGMSRSGISIPGRPAKPGEHLQADQMIVNESFFGTMGIALLQGRAFAYSDTAGAPRVAVVNEIFARSFLANDNAVGRIFKHGSQDVQIVGVCGNAKYWDIRHDVPPIMYLPYPQRRQGRMCFEVRSVLPPASIVPAVRKAVAALDRNIPLTGVRTQVEQIRSQLIMERLFATLCSFVALLALLLSCVGLYGLMAYNVARRANEIGIRVALGARPQDVAWPVVRSALLMAAIGTGLGGAGALALVQLIKSQLYGVAPHDPTTLLGAASLLLIVAALAAWLPARRAARVDPMVALRHE